ncbi:hypothetical protein [Actinomadura flavalba]|uniref:hypothetical protein n=1 Tax=Actinomadura flavalba TaxID=1120938 RepID=UPI00035D48A0|nr:hypothetical protein [Actinomadura flavalba]
MVNELTIWEVGVADSNVFPMRGQRGYGEYMGTTALEVRVQQGAERVELQRLTAALNELRLALADIERLLIERGTTRARWVVDLVDQQDHELVVRVTAADSTQRPRASLLAPVDALVAGVAHLAEEPEVPDFYTEAVIKRLLKLGTPGRGVQEVSLAAVNGKPGPRRVISEPVRQHASRALTGTQTSLGSVSGLLDTVSARGGNLRVGIFDPHTRSSVVGEIPEDLASAVHGDFWQAHVLARGELKRNDRGQVIRIKIDHIERLPSGADKRASVADVLGADPDWTGDMTVDEFVREARRA